MRAFRVAYDGAPFRGFQRQPDVPTVEDALFDALQELDVLPATADKPAGYAAAGRTDAGVSALAQTVAFEAPDWLTPAALNSALPASVRAWASAEAPEGFHATVDAASRAYCYHLRAPDADVARAREVATRFEGTHDFHNLTADDGDTGRTVLDATVARAGDSLRVRVRAEGFVREQVRRMVTVLDAVARGEAGMDRVDAALGECHLDGGEGVGPAPAYPLVLVDVAYPDLSFTVDADAAESARAVFADRRDEHRTRSRVAGTVVDGI
jgi:tRNA pseudouridine38-40 synthase